MRANVIYKSHALVDKCILEKPDAMFIPEWPSMPGHLEQTQRQLDNTSLTTQDTALTPPIPMSWQTPDII